MKKQKTTKYFFIFILLLFALISTDFASANGSATVSWVAPTTEEDGTTPLTDLAGYRIFYSTTDLTTPTDYCADWDAAADQTARRAAALFAISHVDVTEANTIRDINDATKRGYTFSTTNLLTPGQTYYFTVVAYDTSGNYSKCVNDSGLNKVANKSIYRTGKMTDTAGVVNLTDLSLFVFDWGKTNWCRLAGRKADINGDCTVNLTDLSIFAFEWNK